MRLVKFAIGDKVYHVHPVQAYTVGRFLDSEDEGKQQQGRQLAEQTAVKVEDIEGVVLVEEPKLPTSGMATQGFVSTETQK